METPEERVRREQEEIKRGMAERNLAMHQMEAQHAPPSQYQIPSYGRSAFPPEPAPAELEPPPPKTPKEEMEEILSFFAKDVKATMDRVGALRQQRNMLLDERFVALAKERLAVQQIAQTEAQQMAAAEAEDYELAERLQVILDGHQREKAEVTAILENISRALSLLDVQTPNVVGAVTACFRQVETDLKDFQSRQQSVEKEDGTEAQKRFTATSKQLSAEDERLKSELKHIERDEGLASEERKELDGAISENTADMERERAAAKEKLVFVEGEIEFLRKQLQEKQTEAIRLQNEVSFHEGEIEKVKTKFSRQLLRVEKKETSVNENKKEWENEKTAYDTLKKAHEAEVAAHSEELLANTEVMEALKKEVTLAGTFCDVVSKALVFDDSPRNEATEADGDLAELQADVVKCEAARSEAKQVLKAAEATIVGLKTEIDSLQQRIPSLEKEKKEAAARRDFKTAGSASKAIKEATARLTACEAEVHGEATEKRKAAEAEMEKLSKELEEKKAVAHEKEKEAGRETMEKLAEKIRGVINTKKNVCGTQRGDSIQGMGAHVLKAQIQALVLEGHAYGEKFGGWEDFMKELNDDEPLEPAARDEKGSQTLTRPNDAIDRDVVMKAKQLMERMQVAESDLEDAVSKEDYEKAAELDDVFKDIQAKLEKLSLTDAETELVMSGGDLPEETRKEETVEETAGTDADPSSEEPSVAEGSDEKQEETKEEEDTTVKEESNDAVDGTASGDEKPEVSAEADGDHEVNPVKDTEPQSDSENPTESEGCVDEEKPTTNGVHVVDESKAPEAIAEDEEKAQNGTANHDVEETVDPVENGDDDL
uniref:UVR domain-containing protein n=1 Tax=Grammatophora oceanica TaxID=210454 RepID=A0A7S1YI52_9STRA